MFGAQNNPAHLYSQVSVETGVSNAGPHRLIELLYEGADDLLAAADTAISVNDLATKGESITRVIRIVDEGLRASLDSSAGEISTNLSNLYDYILRRLLEANRLNSRELLAEVRSLMTELHSAWSAIGPNTHKVPGSIAS